MSGGNEKREKGKALLRRIMQNVPDGAGTGGRVPKTPGPALNVAAGLIHPKQPQTASRSVELGGRREGTAGGAVCPAWPLDLKRVYEAAPFPERAGRLPLGQVSKREEAGIAVTGQPR